MAILMLILNILLAIATGFLDAVVFKFMWGWFIVPLGAPLISFWHSYGILMMISLTHIWKPNMLKNNNKNINKGEDDSYSFEFNLTQILISLLIWGIGALVHFGV